MDRTSKIWLVTLMLVLIILFGQCSPYAGKSLLTFFFDGVPLTDSSHLKDTELVDVIIDSTDQFTEISNPGSPMVFVHYPYGERECASCHDPNSLGTMVEPQPGLCYMCHEDFSSRYTILHGPVAGGYCTSCHNPHSSESEKLLRFSGMQLCHHCHEAESVFKNEIHQDLEGMECTDCHNPHGGEDKYIFN